MAKRMMRSQGEPAPAQMDIMNRLALAAQITDSPMVTAIVAQGIASISTTGLIIHQEITEDDWKALYGNIQRFRKAFQWIIGDWMLYGFDHDWSTTYEDMADLTGLKEKTVKEYTYVCRNVDPSIRMDTLSFGHFQVIAALPDGDKQHWINRAVDEELSIKKMTHVIRTAYKLTAETVETETLLPSSIPLHNKSYRKPISRILMNLSRGTLERIHRSDIPAVRDWLNKVERLIEEQKIPLKKQ